MPNSKSQNQINILQNQPIIKIEIAEEENKGHKYDFSNVNDLIFTDVILNVLIEELLNLKKSIDKFKNICISYRRDGISEELYLEKHKLIRDYIKNQENTIFENNYFQLKIGATAKNILENLYHTIGKVQDNFGEKDKPLNDPGVSYQLPSLKLPVTRLEVNPSRSSIFPFKKTKRYFILKNKNNKGYDFLGKNGIFRSVPKKNKIITKIISKAIKIRKFKKDLHKCEKCSKVFSNKKVMKRHIKAKHAPLIVSRSLNSRPPTKKSNLDVNHKFSCKQCTKSFKYLSHLIRHELVHRREKFYKCDICEKKFSCLGSLKQHRKNIHNLKFQKDVSEIKCNICHKSFKYKSQLNLHEQMHKNGKTLRRRVKKHNNREKAFKCEICGNLFTLWKNLLAHKRIHTGQKPYECEICGKKFFQSSNLYRHKRSNEKQFECGICGKKLSYKGCIQYHKQLHSDELLV